MGLLLKRTRGAKKRCASRWIWGDLEPGRANASRASIFVRRRETVDAWMGWPVARCLSELLPSGWCVEYAFQGKSPSQA